MAKFNWKDDPVTFEIHPDGSFSINDRKVDEAEFAEAWLKVTGDKWDENARNSGVIDTGSSWGPTAFNSSSDTVTVTGGGGGGFASVGIGGNDGGWVVSDGGSIDLDPPHWGSAAVRFLGNTCGSCGRDEMEIVESEFDDGGWEITNKLLCNSCSHERLDVFRFHHYE